MSEHPYHDQLSLEEKAAEFGKRALELGLIPRFDIRYFPDVWEFYIPSLNTSSPLTPEEAYHHLKRLVEEAGH